MKFPTKKVLRIPGTTLFLGCGADELVCSASPFLGPQKGRCGAGELTCSASHVFRISLAQFRVSVASSCRCGCCRCTWAVQSGSYLLPVTAVSGEPVVLLLSGSYPCTLRLLSASCPPPPDPSSTSFPNENFIILEVFKTRDFKLLFELQTI